ncbi:MAG: MoxR family ATPase [Bacilli bacterium]|nr:MoxR family ATPase [Bacilli bacterium]
MNNEVKSNITNEEIEKSINIINGLSTYYDERIVGQRNLKNALIISFMIGGHILLESVPGLAKTTGAKVLTDAVNAKFSKIQCTPDLLPSDIVGTQIFNYSTNKFDTIIGPINANFVLLDEVNRSSAKTQSAMLEVMQEKKVTIAGVTYKMPDPFVVIATQNPIEQEGTYLLSEAQTDRFVLKEIIDYPTPEEEVTILDRIESGIIDEVKPVMKVDSILYLQQIVKKVYVDDSIKKYITSIIDATRHPEKYISRDLVKYIELGSSPRGAIAIMNVAKAIALWNKRTYVTPDDCKAMIHSILRHRIVLNYAAVADGIKVEQVIDSIMGAINTP